MGIKSLIRYGVKNDNILIRIYFIFSLGWLGFLLLTELIFLLGGREEIFAGGLSIVELLYVLLVLTLIGLLPMIPFFPACIKKQYSKKPEGVEEKSKEEAPSEEPAPEEKEPKEEAKEEKPEEKQTDSK